MRTYSTSPSASAKGPVTPWTWLSRNGDVDRCDSGNTDAGSFVLWSSPGLSRLPMSLSISHSAALARTQRALGSDRRTLPPAGRRVRAHLWMNWPTGGPGARGRPCAARAEAGPSLPDSRVALTSVRWLVALPILCAPTYPPPSRGRSAGIRVMITGDYRKTAPLGGQAGLTRRRYFQVTRSMP